MQHLQCLLQASPHPWIIIRRHIALAVQEQCFAAVGLQVKFNHESHLAGVQPGDPFLAPTASKNGASRRVETFAQWC